MSAGPEKNLHPEPTVRPMQTLTTREHQRGEFGRVDSALLGPPGGTMALAISAYPIRKIAVAITIEIMRVESMMILV